MQGRSRKTGRCRGVNYPESWDTRQPFEVLSCSLFSLLLFLSSKVMSGRIYVVRGSPTDKVLEK